MRTCKIVRIFISLFLCIGCFLAYSQEVSNLNETVSLDFIFNKWDSICNVNIQIEDEIKTARDSSIKLSKKINDIDEKYKRLSDSISYYEGELKQSIDKKSFEAIQAEIDSLQKTVNELKNRKTELNQSIVDNESSLSKNDEKLKNMGTYSKFLDEKNYSQYLEFMKKPYSKMSLDSLSQIELKIESFSEMPNFEEFKMRVEVAKQNKKIFDEADSLLTVNYDSLRIISAHHKINALLKVKKDDLRKGILKLSESQYAELDTLDIKLSRYSRGIDVLQDIVKRVNESGIREKYKNNEDACINKNACIEEMDAIVNSKEKEDIYNRERYFDMIRELRELYKKYWEELQNNPFEQPTETENLIMQLKDQPKD